jgi:predicted GTPase
MEANMGKVTIVDTPGLTDGTRRDGQFMTKLKNFTQENLPGIN